MWVSKQQLQHGQKNTTAKQQENASLVTIPISSPERIWKVYAQNLKAEHIPQRVPALFSWCTWLVASVIPSALDKWHCKMGSRQSGSNHGRPQRRWCHLHLPGLPWEHQEPRHFYGASGSMWRIDGIQTVSKHMWAQEKRRWIYMNLYVSNGHQKWCTSHSFIVFLNILWYRSILCITKRWLSVAAVSCLIPLANTINAKAPGHQDVANAWPSQGLPGLAQSCFSMKPIQIFNPKSCNFFQIAVQFISNSGT